ncbi:predicted protein [Plenodomus lingam JN3]|uniref:Predicted protein n=1 Tax=Leptosphaeria maculans (strain JN3 / isolate v23.1.3 / race Av1-4-5-6-7-8) TaxID=985895 RepID=E5A1V8_LEPMJ|nr:predicted protein [Plenodomus lingam JN3]CBX97675.1 predicted protein [Plenodomus lingam JN3]
MADYNKSSGLSWHTVMQWTLRGQDCDLRAEFPHVDDPSGCLFGRLRTHAASQPQTTTKAPETTRFRNEDQFAPNHTTHGQYMQRQVIGWGGSKIPVDPGVDKKQTHSFCFMGGYFPAEGRSRKRRGCGEHHKFTVHWGPPFSNKSGGATKKMGIEPSPCLHGPNSTMVEPVVELTRLLSAFRPPLLQTPALSCALSTHNNQYTWKFLALGYFWHRSILFVQHRRLSSIVRKFTFGRADFQNR